METGAALAPTDPVLRLATGRTVTGLPANRAVAGAEVALQVVPIAAVGTQALRSSSRSVTLTAEELARIGSQSRLAPRSLGAAARSEKPFISRAPKTIQDRMTLDAAKQGQGDIIMEELDDPRFKGMVKKELIVRSDAGNVSVVHYVEDPLTGIRTDFKFKKHSVMELDKPVN